MGGCLSSKSKESSSRGHRKPSANVVSANGELRQYAVPVTVAQVLQSETSSPNSFFLCNSDRLNFDDYIPSLHSHEELQPDQIYFVLPTNKLQYRLAASDMAALAVKASVALEQINRRNGNRKARISPVVVAEEDPQFDYQVNETKISSHGNNYYQYNNNKAANNSSTTGLGASRSGSVKKLARYSSRRAKLAVRSFRIKLNTIYEGSVHHFN